MVELTLSHILPLTLGSVDEILHLLLTSLVTVLRQLGKPADLDEEDDETKKIDGIMAIIIGPDGVPLKRNNSDVMNNFYI
jgi:hypothetical protein